jgi:hypothetical protein
MNVELKNRPDRIPIEISTIIVFVYPVLPTSDRQERVSHFYIKTILIVKGVKNFIPVVLQPTT